MDIDLDKYRELYLDTFLHFACGDWPNHERHNIHVPFVTDGWKMATDGRIMMAMPTKEPDTERRDRFGNVVYRLPSMDCLRPILSPCLESWGEEARSWPQVNVGEVISEEDEDDGREYVVLDWDRQIVTQAHYYWMIERLARSYNRQLEFRICEIEYRICDTETSIQFRSVDRNDFGQPQIFGVLMLVKPDTEKRSILARTLRAYRNKKELDARKDSEASDPTTEKEESSE